jgi:hypothetical protein
MAIKIIKNVFIMRIIYDYINYYLLILNSLQDIND